MVHVLLRAANELLHVQRVRTLLPFSPDTVWPFPWQSGVISHEGFRHGAPPLAGKLGP